ncbi:hypothetical protein B296_00027353 [Ensete ventricosum]|uniref:Uncharacterized protein n=1 Tax=Ensete ventricosum TaxID=4639 RepID=A0A426Z766_ENSVE|nr:hypothetical protein B296_00027353 [Ensete ventricosum]
MQMPSKPFPAEAFTWRGAHVSAVHHWLASLLRVVGHSVDHRWIGAEIVRCQPAAVTRIADVYEEKKNPATDISVLRFLGAVGF